MVNPLPLRGLRGRQRHTSPANGENIMEQNLTLKGSVFLYKLQILKPGRLVGTEATAS